MRHNSDLSAEELPPKPDPVTGLPRPPRAPSSKIEQWSKERNPFTGRPRPPRDRSNKSDSAPQDHSRKLGIIAVPVASPPEGEGPLLEYYRHGYKREVFFTILLLTVYAGFLVLVSAMNPGHQIPLWLSAAVFVGIAAYSVYNVRGSDCAAGVEWLSTGRGEWVRTYDVVEFSTIFRGIDMALYLKDNSGRSVQVNGGDLVANDDLWDLVYNGIIHSIILNEAKTTNGLRAELNLPHPQCR